MVGPNILDVLLKFVVGEFDVRSGLRGAANEDIVVAPGERVHMEPEVGSDKVADGKKHK
jgi:hypothetical protein